ncbi:MAG TPA: hypothetical protein VGE96_00925 [Steroidobacteraceae bacterium]|jgi:hypothetical protein
MLTAPLIFQNGSTPYAVSMDSPMEVKSVRRELARKLQQEDGGPSAFADKIGRSLAQVSAILGPRAAKGIGDELARHIEQKHGRDRGWLDQASNLHQEGTAAAAPTETSDAQAELARLRAAIDKLSADLWHELRLHRVVLNRIAERVGESEEARDSGNVVSGGDGGTQHRGPKVRSGRAERGTAKSAAKERRRG